MNKKDVVDTMVVIWLVVIVVAFMAMLSSADLDNQTAQTPSAGKPEAMCRLNGQRNC